MAKTGLPLYELQISASEDSELQVSYVALVDQPAIEKDFIAFTEQTQKLSFAVDTDRHIISGAAMLADTPIYRNDDQMGEYMVVFKAPTILQICQKFFAKGYNQNFNIMHDPKMKVEGVCVFESFITDKSRGIQPMKGFEDVPDGSWFLSAQVNNPQVWAAVKEGLIKGFSVEGIFAYEKKKMSAEMQLAALRELFSEI